MSYAICIVPRDTDIVSALLRQITEAFEMCDGRSLPHITDSDEYT